MNEYGHVLHDTDTEGGMLQGYFGTVRINPRAPLAVCLMTACCSECGTLLIAHDEDNDGECPIDLTIFTLAARN